jgi:hypothetical protein
MRIGFRMVSALAIGAAVTAAGCGTGQRETAPTARDSAALTAYVHRIEPLRLAVNRLLEQADPILESYRDHRISPRTAAARFGRLEHRFAAYTTRIAALEPATLELARLQRTYLHTYFFEDAYLSALTAALPNRDFEGLPHTANLQRAMIIEWRTGLEVLARRLGVRLPADLAVAGRGEIAPSPEGS